MKIIAGVTLLLLLAFLGARWTFTRVRLPLAARHIYLTGTEFILVGLCLGPALLDLLDQPTLRGLSPVSNLALGWVGLMFGAQLELRQLARFPRQYMLVALVQGLATLTICFVALLLLPAWPDPCPTLPAGALQASPMVSALVLAAMAIPTAQSSLALIEQELQIRQHPLMRLLRYVAGIDALMGLLLFGVVFALSHHSSPFGIETAVPLQQLLLAVAAGLLTGAVLHLLTRLQCAQEELLLFVVGVVAFSAGAAAFLKISPLFVTLVGGLVVANVQSQKDRIIRALVRLEQPLYLLLLLLGGARIDHNVALGVTLLWSLAYVGLRLAGKLLGGLTASLLLRSPERLPPGTGLGLVSQGGIVVAMVVSLHQAFAGPAADTILVMVLLAVLINELASPALVRRLLQGAT